MSDIGDFHGLCVGFVVFWVGSPHMGGGALFAAKPGYAQPLGALGLNYSVVLSAWKYHARPLVYAMLVFVSFSVCFFFASKSFPIV